MWTRGLETGTMLRAAIIILPLLAASSPAFANTGPMPFPAIFAQKSVATTARASENPSPPSTTYRPSCPHERRLFYETYFVLLPLIVLLAALSGWLWISRRRSRQMQQALQNEMAERKEAEKRSRMTQFAVEHASLSLLLVDSRGNIAYANQKACDSLGYSREELRNKTVFDIDPDLTREQFLDNNEHLRRHGSRTFESRHRRRDGTVFPVEVRLNYFEYEGERYSCAFDQDISDRKRAEEDLRKLNEELERRVEQRTEELASRVREVERLNAAMLNLADDLRLANQELRRTAERLATANRELEAFSYSVSHDLRAPLRAMDGFSQAVLEDYENRLDETGRDYLRRIRAAAQQMGNLIDAILALSRVNKSELVLQNTDLSELARQVAEELRQNEPNRRVEVVIASGLTARGDAALLRQLLANLLENAWKFTAPRGETARIELTTLSAEQAAALGRTGQTVYVVRDNGVGFDPAYAGKLFGAFQRLHSRAEFPGMGIGLATVRRIVQRHGGEVWAEGAVDQGATFYFTLSSRPLAPGKPSSAMPAEGEAPKPV